MKEFKTFIDRRTDLIFCLLALIVGFVMRLIIGHAQIITHDGILYIRIAKDISAGNLHQVNTYGFFSLYPFVISLFHTFLQDWELSGKMVSTIFGSLTIVPLYFLLKRLFNRNVGFVASLLYAVHPRYVEYSSDVLREPLFWFFCVTALWLAWEAMARLRSFLIVLSSLSCAFAIFTRLEGALVFSTVILWIAWFLVRRKETRTKGLIYACVFVFAIPILALPGVVILQSRLQKWEFGLSVDKITQLLIDENRTLESAPDLPSAPPSRFQNFLELSERHQYVTFFVETFYKFGKSINIVVLLLIVFGLYRRRAISYSEKEAAIVIWFAVAFIGSYVYVAKTYYLGTRHGLVMGLASLAWAGAGLFEVRERIRAWLRKRQSSNAHLKYDTTVLVFLVLLMLVPQTALSYRSDKVELKTAGNTLKATGFSGSTFLVPWTLARVAFYADADMVQLPLDPNESVLKEFFAQNRGSILLLDNKSVDEYLPGLRKIVAESGFEKIPIPIFQTYCKYSFVLYRIS